MLLQSDRHTPEDLEIWSVLEESDLDRKVKSVDLSGIPSCDYIATSWGKDSVVVCHAARNLGLPLVHIRTTSNQRDPYQSDVRDEFLRQFPHVNYIEMFVGTNKHQSPGSHAPFLDIGISRCKDVFGPKWCGGLRADESSSRMLASFTDSKSSFWPIKRWSADDVFAYLAQNQLPVHPSYSMVGGGRWDRKQLRVSIIGGQKGRGFGRDEWEMEYYPDIINRMKHAASQSNR